MPIIQASEILKADIKTQSPVGVFHLVCKGEEQVMVPVIAIKYLLAQENTQETNNMSIMKPACINLIGKHFKNFNFDICK